MQQIEEQPGDLAAVAVPAPRRRHRRLFAGLAAGTMAVVVALWSVTALGFGVGKFWAGQTAAGDLLGRIALVASSNTDIPPANQVRDDQFIYIETYGGFGPAQAGSTALNLHRRQIWLSVNGVQAGLLRDPVVSPQDLDLGPDSSPGLNDPTFRYLTTLTTNPDALLAKIYLETWGAGPNPQEEAFVTIGDLMRESIVPPDLAAALYKAAARIPGITVVDDAVDALGRHGVAIARAGDGDQTEWIFDRNSLAFLGERTVATQATADVPAGTVTGSTAIVTRAIVDHAGDLP
jgi:hypothetical protein